MQLPENIAIRSEGLGKKYRIGTTEVAPDMLREKISGAIRSVGKSAKAALARTPPMPNNAGDFWALNDVTFEVRKGEKIGIIGKNGAGKSTLLKLLSRITEPSTGRISMRGRVSSLLEVGTGFHPELTGRENIFLNGSVMGMTRKQIKSRFDEIVDFAEIETFLETPVKRYSSGMFVRLAFSVAAHLEPDILLVDEVLAVGDNRFQKKCLNRISQISDEGRTIIFVSHTMAMIRSLCSRVLLLEEGSLVRDGPPNEIVEAYLRSSCMNQAVSLSGRTDRNGTGSARIKNILVESQVGDGVIRSDSELRIQLDYTGDTALPSVRVVLSIYEYSGAGLFVLDSGSSGTIFSGAPESGTFICETAPINLTPGYCYINVRLMSGETLIDQVASAVEFHIESSAKPGSEDGPNRDWVLCLLDNSWSVSG
jgi:homopolymeric O-antigen transport system ATP-binding protein